MKKLPNIFKIDNKLPPKKGRILISQPLLNDGIFARSIVLITEHNQNGTIGFVLNKLAGYTLREIFPEFKGIKLPVYIGGPVSTNSLHFIYKYNKPLPNSHHIIEDLYWNGNLKELKEYLYNNIFNETNIKFFIGYSGWAKGQLKQELENSFWIVNDIYDLNSIFTEDYRNMWKRNVIRLEKKYHFWLNVPLNPQLN